ALAIVERDNDVSAELFVLGSHLPRTGMEGLLGTTADHVLRTSPVPCLLVNAPLRIPLRHVVVGTDFSPTARRGADLIAGWLVGAREHDGPVHLEVVSVSAFAQASPAPAPVSIEPKLEREVARLRGRLPPETSVQVRGRIVSEPFVTEGLARAAADGADLVVMGTHGYGGLLRFLLGSHASRVARTVDHPLLLVPPAHGTLP